MSADVTDVPSMSLLMFSKVARNRSLSGKHFSPGVEFLKCRPPRVVFFPAEQVERVKRCQVPGSLMAVNKLRADP